MSGALFLRCTEFYRVSLHDQALPPPKRVLIGPLVVAVVAVVVVVVVVVVVDRNGGPGCHGNGQDRNLDFHRVLPG